MKDDPLKIKIMALNLEVENEILQIDKLTVDKKKEIPQTDIDLLLKYKIRVKEINDKSNSLLEIGGHFKAMKMRYKAYSLLKMLFNLKKDFTKDEFNVINSYVGVSHG